MLRSLGGQRNNLLFALNALPDETATELGAVDPEWRRSRSVR